MTLKSGTSQACAACKYQRRKCTPDCQLAPYFPPDKPNLFLNAHRLFGVSNILKILKHLKPAEKPEAMATIIYQSNVRDKFPVLGCVGVMQHCIHQIRQCEEEIRIVHSLLALAHQIQPSSLGTSQLQLGMAPSTHGAPDNFSYSSCCTNAYNPAYVDSNENASLWPNSPEIKSLTPPAMPEEVILEYGEIKPYFDPNQSYATSKKAYDSSPESSMTDTMQSIEHIEQNELKTAAACFTLTSVN